MDFGCQAYPRWSGIFSKYSWYFRYVTVKLRSFFTIFKGTFIQIVTYLVVCNRASRIPSDTCSWNVCHIYNKCWTFPNRFCHLILHPQRESACWKNKQTSCTRRKEDCLFHDQPTGNTQSTAYPRNHKGSFGDKAAIGKSWRASSMLRRRGCDSQSRNHKHGDLQLHPFCLSCSSKHPGTAEK